LSSASENGKEKVEVCKEQKHSYCTEEKARTLVKLLSRMIGEGRRHLQLRPFQPFDFNLLKKKPKYRDRAFWTMSTFS
jgi:hypothetical protein